MHQPAPELMKRMICAEAGIWPATVNFPPRIALAVKLPTEAIKWVSRGVPVTLFIGHVQTDGRTIRCLGLAVEDTPSDPFRISAPQVEEWEVEGFDRLLSETRFRVHFHGEMPEVSVADALGELDAGSLATYLEERRGNELQHASSTTDQFRAAQQQFERSATGVASSAGIKVWRLPLRLSQFQANQISFGESPSFHPTEGNEGTSFEILSRAVLESFGSGEVLLNPKRKNEGNDEWCDVALLGEGVAVVCQAKAFTVFDKSPEQTVHRKAASAFSHFKKAAGQLKGAITFLERGGTVVTEDAGEREVNASAFRSIHAVAILSSTTLPLPWSEIRATLANSQGRPGVSFSLLTLAEFRRIIAFSRGEWATLDRCLRQLAVAQAVPGSGPVGMEFAPEPPSILNSPELSSDSEAVRFGFSQPFISGASVAALLNGVVEAFGRTKFTGRVEIYHEAREIRGVQAYWLGLATSSTHALSVEGHAPWNSFAKLLREEFLKLVQISWIPGTAKRCRLSRIKRLMPDRLVVFEFLLGQVTARLFG